MGQTRTVVSQNKILSLGHLEGTQVNRQGTGLCPGRQRCGPAGHRIQRRTNQRLEVLPQRHNAREVD